MVLTLFFVSRDSFRTYAFIRIPRQKRNGWVPLKNDNFFLELGNQSIFSMSKFQQQSALPNKWLFFSHGTGWRGILMLDQNTRLSMMPGSFATESTPILFLFQRGQDHKTPKICTASKSESRHNKWPWISKSVLCSFGPHFRDRGHLHPARQHHRSVVFSATAFLSRKTTSGQLWSKNTRFLYEQCQKPLKKIFHCTKSDKSSW